MTDRKDLPPCDLVMKGGITSGVIYPRAAVALSRRYRLVNVGGASAGAIAAALAAAAEHGEGNGGSGYNGLAALPDDLAAAGARGEPTAMLALFQPGPHVRPLHDLLLRVLAAPRTLVGRVRAALAGGLSAAVRVRSGWWKVVVGLAPGALLVVLGTPSPGDVSSGVALAAGLTAALLAIVGLTTGARMAVGAAATLVAAIAVSALLDDPAASWMVAVCVVLAIVGALVAAALTLVLSGLREIRANGLGLVHGMGDDHALTPWLHRTINEVSGTRNGVLTFGDLWGAGDDREAKRRLEAEPRHRAVNLQLMTTNLSEGRPQRQPLREPDYLYDPEEFSRLFPSEVVEHLLAVEQPPPPGARRDERREYELWNRVLGLRRLPIADLPVIVATRMSLSFPVLLAPVPLYTIDWTRAHNRAVRARWRKWVAELPAGTDPVDHPGFSELLARADHRFLRTRCWISDGGITSNMPLHFFDAPFPRWPTFAINLGPHHPDHVPARDAAPGEHVFLPESNQEGREVTVRLTDGDRPPSLLGFLASILDCMQNWTDNAQARMPGYRERIVRIAHFDDEGGMNLNMAAPAILSLAARGEAAGQRLVGRFADGDGWENHRWVRFRSFMAMIERTLTRAATAYDDPDVTSRTYRALLHGPLRKLPSYEWRRRGQAAWARSRADSVMALGARWFEPEEGGVAPGGFFADDAPVPTPELRAQPFL